MRKFKALVVDLLCALGDAIATGSDWFETKLKEKSFSGAFVRYGSSALILLFVVAFVVKLYSDLSTTKWQLQQSDVYAGSVLEDFAKLQQQYDASMDRVSELDGQLSSSKERISDLDGQLSVADKRLVETNRLLNNALDAAAEYYSDRSALIAQRNSLEKELRAQKDKFSDAISAWHQEHLDDLCKITDLHCQLRIAYAKPLFEKFGPVLAAGGAIVNFVDSGFDVRALIKEVDNAEETVSAVDTE